jgi:hypothetical protein
VANTFKETISKFFCSKEEKCRVKKNILEYFKDKEKSRMCNKTNNFERKRNKILIVSKNHDSWKVLAWISQSREHQVKGKA